jgi:hypothetical protein
LRKKSLSIRLLPLNNCLDLFTKASEEGLVAPRLYDFLHHMIAKLFTIRNKKEDRLVQLALPTAKRAIVVAEKGSLSLR